jgi:hypothetical protein
LSYIKIGKSVIVKVADSCPHPITASGDPCRRGDIRECAITIVSIKGIAQWRRWIIKVAAAAIHEIEVHPSITVVIDESAPGSRRLGKIVLRRPAINMFPVDSAGRRLHRNKQRT